MKLFHLFFKFVIGVFGLLLVLYCIEQYNRYMYDSLQEHCRAINYDFTRSASRTCSEALTLKNNILTFRDLDNKIEVYEVIFDGEKYNYNFIKYQ